MSISIRHIKNYKKTLYVLLAFCLLVGLGVLRSQRYNRPVEKHAEHPEKVDIGGMILEHIGDEHAWFLFAYNGRNYEIPLPIILIHDDGLHIFFSDKIAHGNVYRNFTISHNPKNHGKIVHLSTSANGQVVEDDILPIDLSITKNAFSLIIVSLLMCWVFISMATAYKKRGIAAPKDKQALLEPIVSFIWTDVILIAMDAKRGLRFAPFLLTIFFFILFNNLMGLIPFFPGGANVTGNIAVTGILAICVFITVNINGNKHYWQDIFNSPNAPWWLKIPLPILPIVEILGVFTKPIVLMIRLFANMAAGHIIVLGLLGIIFIFGQISTALGFGVSPVSVAFSLFISLLELLVAFIQAYVFTLLSAMYIGMATETHAHPEKD